MRILATPKPNYAGGVDGLCGNMIHGWAIDQNDHAALQIVEIYVDGTYVGVARADQPQSVCPTSTHDGFHAFSFELRWEWLEGAKAITVRIANVGHWLGEVCLDMPPISGKDNELNSRVWHSGGLCVTGFVRDAENENRSVEVTALCEDRVVSRALANYPHPALANTENFRHGFKIELPVEFADGLPHVVELIDDRGRTLSEGLLTVCTELGGLEGLIRKLWPSSPTETPAFSSLIALARETDRRWPNDFGFSHYQEWHATWHQLPDLARTSARETKIGVLVYTRLGETEVDPRTQRSLEAQRHPPALVKLADSANVVTALHEILQSGVAAVMPLPNGDQLDPCALDILLDTLLNDHQITDKISARASVTIGSDARLAQPDVPIKLHASHAWVYADSDSRSDKGRLQDPWFKPTWDLDYFLGRDVFTAGSLWDADMLASMFQLPDHPSNADIDGLAAAVVLTVSKQGRSVAHVPRVLNTRGPEHSAEQVTPVQALKRIESVDWLAKMMCMGATATINHCHPDLIRVHWPLPPDNELPKVTLIVPTRDNVELLRTCIEGLLTNTDYKNLEIVVVNNDSALRETHDYLYNLRTRGVVVLDYPHAFNYAAINNFAVSHATGDIVGLINNDIEVIEPGWLREMVSNLLRPGVGVVGAKLLWANRMVQHCGVVVNVNGLAAHVGNDWLDDDRGYMSLNQLNRRVSAVTAACLLVRKSLYENIGGLDSNKYPVAFNDVEFCLSASRTAAVLLVASAKLIHAESASRGKDDTMSKQARFRREAAFLYDDVYSLSSEDPYYHPALSRHYGSGPYGGLSGNFNQGSTAA